MEEQAEEPPAPDVNHVRAYIMLAALALVVGFGVFGVWKYNQSPDTDVLAEQVKASMNQTLDTDANFKQYSFDVKSVTVIHASGNEYSGMATVTANGGPEHQVPITVTAADGKIMWKSEPGAMMFAVQENAEAAG